MNRPLTHGKDSFYQSSFQELPGGKEVSILSVAYDPGLFLKYSGSFMICLGIFIMCFMRGVFVSKRPGAVAKDSSLQD